MKILGMAVEAWANLAVGYILSLALLYAVLPLFWGIVPTAGDAMSVTLLYSVVSFLRSFAIRWVFDRWLKEVFNV